MSVHKCCRCVQPFRGCRVFDGIIHFFVISAQAVVAECLITCIREYALFGQTVLGVGVDVAVDFSVARVVGEVFDFPAL